MTTSDNSDSNTLPLRPRARILRTLGEELISNETVALCELIKNSYDADARLVLIRFSGPFEEGEGMIEVFDDGTGMNLRDVQTVWMEPATYAKKRKERSEKLKRRVLGEKGIGRFASSRLADELNLISREEDSENETYVVFDWTQFDDENKYLDQILILTEERKPLDICHGGSIDALFKKDKSNSVERNNNGTVLRMTGLKQTWSKENFKNVQRVLSRLVSPLEHPSDFRIFFELPDDFIEYSTEITPPEVIKHPHYIVHASVDECGVYKISLDVRSRGLKREWNGEFAREKESNKMLMRDADTINADENKDTWSLPECGPFDLELRIWDRDELGNVEQVIDSSIQDIRKDLDEIAGINIYRDKFRVLPYGEPKNDWLRLDIRRVLKPTMRLSNNQIVGNIQITANDNPALKDQSNREGLFENQASKDLGEIMHYILEKIENVRYFEGRNRDRKDKTTTKPMTGLFASFDLNPLKEHITTKYPNDKESQNLIEDTFEKFSMQLGEVKTVLARYQSLATLGQLIDMILHDGRTPVAKMVNQAVINKEEIEELDNKDDHPFPMLHKGFDLIENQGGILSTLFKRIDPFGGRKKGRPQKLYLEKIIENAFAVFEIDLKKYSVNVELPETETLVSLDGAEIQEVIVNLLQNSLHWLKHVDKNKRLISVLVKRKAEDHVEITFADSGPGVEKNDREKIFEPYFSAKKNGVGLGLSIAGEIVSDYYGGKIELMETEPLGGAAFRITLQKRV